MSVIAWQETYQPKTTPWVRQPNWTHTVMLGAVVSFKIAHNGGKLFIAQAYPVGTGNAVSDKVEWVMDHAQGPFRFGTGTGPSGKRLMVQLVLDADKAGLQARFPTPAGTTSSEGEA